LRRRPSIENGIEERDLTSSFAALDQARIAGLHSGLSVCSYAIVGTAKQRTADRERPKRRTAVHCANRLCD